MVYLKLALLVAVFAHCKNYVTCLSPLMFECPDGSIYNAKADLCWKYMGKKDSWDRGLSLCRGLGGTLPMPKTNVIQQELILFRNQHVGNRNMWLGLNDLQRSNQFMWDDGTPLSGVTQWNAGEPNNGGIWNNEHCVHMGEHNILHVNELKAGWNDLLCSLHLDIVCEYKRTSGHKRSCPVGWTFNARAGKCWMNAGQRNNYNGARQRCRNLGATLAMPKTNVIQQELVNFRNGNNGGSMWIGLNDMGHNNRFVWDDGSALTGYKAWNPREPNNGGFFRNEHCVHIGDKGQTGWNDLLCAMKLNTVCEKGIDHCGASPCRNGAACRDSGNDFSCSCLPGYTGKDCAREIDHCATLPCKNGAACRSVANAFYCTCPLGYTGRDCSMAIDYCATRPCKNGAACRSGVDGFLCTCPLGYSGRDCSRAMDYCATNPCKNGALCKSHANGFSCQCLYGFSGHYCETAMDYCATNPCKNRALCKSHANGFSCQCPYGFSGHYCETEINHCATNPCRNGAACSTVGNNFKCTCPLGFTGRQCATTMNFCAASPCKNGAICKSLSNGFSCQCPLGFSGKLCDTVAPMVFLRRVNGKVNFDRNWADYENGFGNRLDCSRGECWLGLKSLYNLCSTNCKLGISMTYKGKNYHAYYTTFKVGPKGDNYRLTIGGHSGTAHDRMTEYNNMQFTTKDQDHDAWSNNCAKSFTGGWWYKACHKAHPTGIFGSKAFAKGINWKSITGFKDSLSTITMKVWKSIT